MPVPDMTMAFWTLTGTFIAFGTSMVAMMFYLLTRVERRLETRLDRVEVRLDRIEETQHEILAELGRLGARLAEIE